MKCGCESKIVAKYVFSQWNSPDYWNKPYGYNQDWKTQEQLEKRILKHQMSIAVNGIDHHMHNTS